MNLTFQKEEIIKEVYRRLSYISGKRAAGADDFFRFSPCEADLPLFRRLVGEAASWLSIRMGISCRSSFISADAITFDVACSEVSASSGGNACNHVSIALAGAIVSRTIYLWLRFSGFSSLSEWEGAAEAEISLLLKLLSSSRHGPLKPRSIMP